VERSKFFDEHAMSHRRPDLVRRENSFFDGGSKGRITGGKDEVEKNRPKSLSPPARHRQGERSAEALSNSFDIYSASTPFGG
jgi:hypothetical protein